MTPTEQDKKLEVALMELFCRSEEFGRTFLTRASKEEFAEAVNGGALDHQQAAHEAMQLITADRKRAANADREVLKDLVVRAAPDGTQDDGDFVGFYVLPTGSVHRAIAYFQDKGGIETLGDASVISRYQAHLKRVALEARIDEMDVALAEVTHWSIDDSDSAIHGYGKHRIAELKAKQEEV